MALPTVNQKSKFATLDMKKRTFLKISIAFWFAVLLAVWAFYDSNSSPWSFGSHYRRVHFEPRLATQKQGWPK